jgi:hypothetical protein
MQVGKTIWPDQLDKIKHKVRLLFPAFRLPLFCPPSLVLSSFSLSDLRICTPFLNSSSTPFWQMFYVSKESFGETAKRQPPYRSVPWYDAKLWVFVERFGKSGDFIWNVGAVPEDVAAAAVSARSLCALG